MTDANDNNGVMPTLNFIADNVAEEDAFKSHGRIANAVAGVIRQKKDLKVIGLLGPWGSGKSTVVAFIQKNLKSYHEKENYYCFTYDAWLHQSDPPRRTFLENLIRFLICEGLTTEFRWNERIQELNRHILDTETTSTPTLSIVGRWLILSALAVPIGMTFIGKDWFEATSKANGTFFEQNAFLFGWVLVSAPLLLATLFYVAWRPTWKFWQRRFWTSHRAPYERESILSVFTNREVVHQKNRTITTPDPTTIEFQTIFREIMSSVFAEGRRFIFVVDNLDRLPEAQAVELWATIRSFFLGADQRLNLPTVILPIDEKAVERMYAVNHPDDATARGLAQSFMDKTFDLKFHVSRPVLSDWNEYLEAQMDALFGQILKPNWSHQLQVILDRWLLSDGRGTEVTPRFINTLLNSIGTLWLQWHGSTIRFVSIAHYAVHRDAIGSEILTEVSKENVWLTKEDPDWQRSLAALHYGVEPDRAEQVLLERPLIEAIQSGTEADFAKSAAVPGFTTVFQRILDRAGNGDAVFPATNAIRLYNALDLPADAASKDAWGRLRTLYLTRFNTSELNRPDVDALETLIARCPDAEINQFLERAAAKLSSIQDAAFAKAEGVANFVHASRTLSSKASELSLTGLKFTIQGNPEFYFKALTLASEDEALLSCLRSNVNDIGKMETLAEMVADPETNQEAATCVRTLKVIGDRLPWHPVVDAAIKILESGSDIRTERAATILGYIYDTEINAKERVRNLAGNGSLQARLHESFNGNNMEATASIAALLLISEKPESITTPDGSTWETALENRKGLSEQIGQRFSAFGGASVLDAYVSIAEQNSALAPLIKAIASSRFRDGDLELPSSVDAAKSFGIYTSYLTDDLKVQFASKVGESPDFWTELASLDLDGNEQTYLALLDEACTHCVEAALAVKGKLKLVAADQWQVAISSGAEPYQLAIALARADATAGLDGNLFDALRLSIPTLCSTGDTAYIERWFELNAALNADLRKTLFLSVRDRLTASDTATDLVSLLSTQGNALLRYGEFEDRADGAARNIIIPLLGSTGLSFLCDHFKAFIPVIKGCKLGSREAIGTQLGATWEAAETQEAKDRIDLLRRNWELPEFAAQANDDPAGA